MTVICGGGPSGSKPGVQQVIVLSALAVEAFLVSIGFDEIAAMLAPLFITAPYNTADFCSQDPPSLPTITNQDIIDALNAATPTASLAAQVKLKQWFDAQYWYYICQCTSTTTPAAPPPTQPPVVGISTGMPGTTAAGVCWDVQKTILVPGGGGDVNHNTNLDVPWFPQVATSGFTDGSYNPLSTAIPVPPGTTGWQGQVTLDRAWTQIGGGTGYHQTTYDSAKNEITRDYVIGTGSTFNVFGRNWPAGTAYISHFVNSSAGNPDVNMTLQMKFLCPAGSVPASCCPPDIVSQNLLRQILAKVQSTDSDVQLLQRYAVPFAYIQGTSHVGITGSGSFSIARSVGMLARVTAQPAGLRQAGGTPTYIYDLGWMSVENGDGMIDEVRLTRDNQVWMSRLFPTAVTFGYFLNPGVTVTFIELDAEP